MLTVGNLNQFYGESHTLWDIDMNIQEGVCMCLMGRNGAGKTTLLKSLMGLLSIQTGAIRFRGKDITHSPTHVRARLGIGYIPQGREIFPQLTVEENLRLGLTTHGSGAGEIPEKVFDLFPVLKKMLKRRGGNLSGGQQQQLAIGRVLVTDPALLILDEPTEGIQPNVVREIGDIILRLNKEDNITVLLVEQKLAFARRIAERFCIIDKGRMVANGPIQDLDERLIQRHLRV